MYEGTPLVPVHFKPTVRLCPGCHVTLEILSHVGLTVNRCVLRFDDMTPQTVDLRAVRTAGRNSRIVTLRFRTVVSAVLSMWIGGYAVKDIRVC